MFARAAEPDPESDDWSGWASLLSNRNHNRQDGPEGAMFILSDTGFGTVSSSLIALPSKENQRLKPKYLFAATKLGDERYITVDTDE